MAVASSGRELDVVIFGATGDTGVAGCCCLYFKAKTLGISSWAPASRNLHKLQRDVLDRMQQSATGPEGVAPSSPSQADSSDFGSLVSMCNRTKCVVACVGPFTMYGESLVKACIESGTHYVDVTGEMPWVNEMKEKYGIAAERMGVCIVCCAGYDSVPPDLATCLAAKALERTGQRLRRFEAFVGGSGGALPTGTLNTMVLGLGEGKRCLLNASTCGLLGQQGMEPLAQAEIADDTIGATGGCYVPEDEEVNLKKNSFWTMIPGYSRLASQFCLPHFMAPVNVHTVHHTASREGYGGLIYREWTGNLHCGLLSLYGLLPVFLGVLVYFIFGLFLAMPGGLKAAVWLRDTFNPPSQERVRAKLFDGFVSTGKTTVDGFGATNGGSVARVSVTLRSSYDPGIGFTMLSACTVAAELVKRKATKEELPKVGFNSAVVAIGAETLADAFWATGTTVNIKLLPTSGGSSEL
eukprot:TRINITY_DN50620_c0_g1_i1.p1 TRINITY_DN50620_c0_g1~~TRINITY_DN50620_c0_g1_i1.p1  ORF type:complete len:493 (+),score=87.09 TRINITY_DN50620_c0_g1_i1:81-1481(+)